VKDTKEKQKKRGRKRVGRVFFHQKREEREDEPARPLCRGRKRKRKEKEERRHGLPQGKRRKRKKKTKPAALLQGGEQKEKREGGTLFTLLGKRESFCAAALTCNAQEDCEGKKKKGREKVKLSFLYPSRGGKKEVESGALTLRSGEENREKEKKKQSLYITHPTRKGFL